MTPSEKKELLRVFERESAAYGGLAKVLIDYWISDAEAAEFESCGESPRRGSGIWRGANGIEHITKTCLASPLLAVVSADRKVYPCCNLRGIEEWSVGTIDYDSGVTFNRIWRGSKRQEVMDRIHRIECIDVCTHPMSRYNEVIEYLRSPRYHKGFV